MNPLLHVVMYHYVRDLPNTAFPRIKGMLTGQFRDQLASLHDQYEMATLESAMDFLDGKYAPQRDMCLLTFDDGLKEHYAEITPLLIDQGVQGLFFTITDCLAGKYLAPVHMNHFLMAALGFCEYRRAFLSRLNDRVPRSNEGMAVNPILAQRAYRWDTAEVASFKYLFNFVLDVELRDGILQDLFEEKLGDAESFAHELYLSVGEARAMQDAGMIIGGHSHRHKPLSSLSNEELALDLDSCYRLLTTNLAPQPYWPFCYPYGKQDSFNAAASNQLKQIGFACSFSTEIGSNAAGADPFTIRRLDCKDVHC